MIKNYLKFCKYYHGGNDCPYPNGTAKAIFWNCERQFVKSHNHEQAFSEGWEEAARSYASEVQDKNVLTDESVPIETKALILFIEAQLEKFCPIQVDMVYEY